MSHERSSGHVERVKKELREAGFTKYGMMKFASRYLPSIIHEDEHIGGAVYGRYRTGIGLLSLTEGMLIATDKRVIFLDHKPGFTSYDEVTYDVVSGAKKSSAGFMYAVTLHTRVTDYTLRFANARCAHSFVHYVEKKRLEKSDGGYAPSESLQPSEQLSPLNQQDNAKAMSFLRDYDTAVLSTLDSDSNIHGAAVHYMVSAEGYIYILTKSGTQKSHNIYANGNVALVVYDGEGGKTVQLQGKAEPETNQAIKDRIFTELIKPRVYGKQKRLPPVVSLHEGSFTIIRITPTSMKLTEFSAT